MGSIFLQSESAVLIVTGAWHVPEHYDRLTRELESEGIRTICPQLPTNNNAVPPNRTLNDDIDLIRKIIAEEVAQGTQLTVLAHSYGGVVATAALSGFGGENQTQADVSSDDISQRVGKVTNLVFMAAFIPLETQSLAGIFGGQLPPYITVDTSNGTLVWTDPIGRLYNDLSAADGQWAESLRVAHSYDAQHTTIEKACEVAAWRVIPTSYIVCENDQALPMFVQESMIQNCTENILNGKGTGKAVRVFRCGGSHSAFLSMPKVCSEFIREIMA